MGHPAQADESGLGISVSHPTLSYEVEPGTPANPDLKIEMWGTRGIGDAIRCGPPAKRMNGSPRMMSGPPAARNFRSDLGSAARRSFLHEAAKGYKPNGVECGSLRVHEHWKDEGHRQYSRNLDSSGEGIG